MKNILYSLLLLCLIIPLTSGTWIVEKQQKFTLYFDSSSMMERNLYIKFFNKGIKEVERFTGSAYQRKFAVFVHSNRASLDDQWQHDRGMPSFKSECWMVASGVGDKLDILAPLQWKEESCEHSLEDTLEAQRLITHELMHVYHGQINKDSVFAKLDNLDWFIEGLATYASGQCTKKRISEVKLLVKNNKAPNLLSDFWLGKDKYGLSGSMVQFIDKQYGRKKLLSLMKMNSAKEVLSSLKITEPELIGSWKKYMLSNK